MLENTDFYGFHFELFPKIKNGKSGTSIEAHVKSDNCIRIFLHSINFQFAACFFCCLKINQCLKEETRKLKVIKFSQRGKEPAMRP